MDIQDLARDWAALPQISSIHASGDGAWVFFCLAGLNEVDEVYVAPADGSAAPLQLTWGWIITKFAMWRLTGRLWCWRSRGTPASMTI